VRLEITESCTGHGRCYDVVPELFEDDDAGFGRVKEGGTVPAELVATARRAVGVCPERAIVLHENTDQGAK
jgi:ferredoxin